MSGLSVRVPYRCQTQLDRQNLSPGILEKLLIIDRFTRDRPIESVSNSGLHLPVERPPRPFQKIHLHQFVGRKSRCRSRRLVHKHQRPVGRDLRRKCHHVIDEFQQLSPPLHQRPLHQLALRYVTNDPKQARDLSVFAYRPCGKFTRQVRPRF
jgi:hypothetical protein